MPHQEALTIVATVESDEVDALKTILGTIPEHVETWDVIPFHRLTGIHFARLVVFDEARDHDGSPIPAQISLMTDVDAPLDAHVRELANVAGEGLDQVFGRCEGYPSASQRNATSRQAFLRRHSRRASAFYVNRQGRSVEQIRREEELRRAIGEFLDGANLTGQSAERTRQAITTFVETRADLRWALRPAERPALAWRARRLVHLIGTVVVLLALSPLLLLLAPLFVVMLRAREKRDVPDTSVAPAEQVARLRNDEDFWGQNQVIAAGLFKPGVFRRITATAILWLTEFACRHVYNRGFLSGLNTIHFARWVGLDGGRRMFFSSNYDGSLESYMNDFIDKAAWGLNAIFSNGDGFPRTRFLFCGGITDEAAYKRFLPTRQVQSRVWYSAYPHLTTKNIANNAEIRKGLSGELSAEETRAWLSRLGAGNRLPESGLIARMLDRIPWDRVCRCSR